MIRSAGDALVVIVDGEEVPGILVYGLFSAGRRLPVRSRPASLIRDTNEPPYRLHGPSWEVFIWTVPIAEWPPIDDFEVTLRMTLQHVIDEGSPVSWVGAEGFPLADPPNLFLPESMTGGVLAWMLDSGESDCHLDPERPISTVSDTTMLELRRHAAGLADSD